MGRLRTAYPGHGGRADRTGRRARSGAPRSFSRTGGRPIRRRCFRSWGLCIVLDGVGKWAASPTHDSWPPKTCSTAQVVKVRNQVSHVVEVKRRAVYGGPRRFGKQLRLRQLGTTIQTAFMERWYGPLRGLVAPLRRRTRCLSWSHTRHREKVWRVVSLYNFVMPHKSLRQGRTSRTPAMAIGLTDHIWSYRGVRLAATAPCSHKTTRSDCIAGFELLTARRVRHITSPVVMRALRALTMGRTWPVNPCPRCCACSVAREEESTGQRSRCRTDQHLEKGGSHEYPTRSTVQPAEIPEGVDARGDRRAAWPVRQTGGRGAAARDDADPARPDSEHLSGPPVCGRSTAAQRRVHRGALPPESRDRRHRDGPRLWRSRPQWALRRAAPPPAGGGRPHRHPGGAPHRLLRTLRDARGPHHPRPEGEDRRRARAGFQPGTSFSPAWWRMWAWTPARTSTSSRIRDPSRCGS